MSEKRFNIDEEKIKDNHINYIQVLQSVLSKEMLGLTEKRVTFDIDNENGIDEPYFCNGTDSFYVNNADEMDLFIKEINELAEENQYLKSLKWNQDCINEISISMQQIQLLKKENEQLKQQLEVYQELYPSGKWICDLNSDELKKELSDDWG